MLVAVFLHHLQAFLRIRYATVDLLLPVVTCHDRLLRLFRRSRNQVFEGGLEVLEVEAELVDEVEGEGEEEEAEEGEGKVGHIIKDTRWASGRIKGGKGL